jgi:uncharacterized membrane protein
MKQHIDHSGTTSVQRSITIGVPAENLYSIWRVPERLADVMPEGLSMTPDAPDQASFNIAGPLGTASAWHARVSEDVPGRAVTWESTDDQENELRVMFVSAPADQGTEAHVEFRFATPGGVIGEAAQKIFATAPEELIGKLLRRLKARAETGEVPTLEFNPAHREGTDQPGEQK